MSILGIMVIMVGVVLFITISIVEECFHIPTFMIAVFGGFLLFYDLSSPVEETSRIIRTTNPQEYNIDVDKEEDTLVTVRIITTEATRAGAVINDVISYELVLTGEEIAEQK